ncbi:STAM-binding protein-like A [Lutzomyia longipalpis]|uniref:STAM-binding protein-like A n=1 Tax=Lutzomyia longipalpis TaxID=7200 RepID=UPI0024843B08|nr:STAM-binding protein-like A [Lutzomyia longipalpis]
MSKRVNFAEFGIVEPQARLKHLANHGNLSDIDLNIPIRRYYRSGMEMVRMAHVYHSEGNLEDAYILYMKFMTLFIEKIKSHPEYKSVPTATKQQNQAKLKEVLPVTEKLKKTLLGRYEKEYAQFLANKEAERAREEAAARERAKNSIPTAPATSHTGATSVDFTPSAPSSELLDSIVYPNDFPSDPNRSSSTGLILPDSEKKPAGRPTFDRNLKPSSSTLLDGVLRTVVVPIDTMTSFLDLAKSNTLNNVETCAILAGRLAHNQLILSHMILPKQKGTSDSCNTMNEEEIFDVQDQHNLITLGWIHTHPSQTAFLSSVDLHTHCSYQMMMPEALAIVCAPKYQETGFFCLTPNYGLEYIAQCRQTGFHPHPNDPPLFMEAQHISLSDKLKIEVVDLRR